VAEEALRESLGGGRRGRGGMGEARAGPGGQKDQKRGREGITEGLRERDDAERVGSRGYFARFRCSDLGEPDWGGRYRKKVRRRSLNLSLSYKIIIKPRNQI
jgi:hypothetical protein